MGTEIMDSIFFTISAAVSVLRDAAEGVARAMSGIRIAISAEGWLHGLEAYARYFGRPL